MNREIKDALRLAKKTRRGYAIGGNPTDPVAGTNPALIAAQPTPLQTSNRLDPSQQYAANLASAGFNQSQIDAMLKSQSAPAQTPAQTPASPFTTAPTSVAAAPVKQSISPQTTATTPVSTAAPASTAPATQSFNVPDYRATFVQNALGRSITPEENTQWQNYINSNQLTDDQIQNSILNSPEAEKYYRSSFVQDYMGRPITEEEHKRWEDYVQSGYGSDEDIENYIKSSDEAVNYDNTEFLKDEYQGLLGREPKPEELAYVLPKLKSGEINYDQFDNYLANTDDSLAYQASNFEPYQEASANSTGVRNRPRTAYQNSRSVPKTSEELNNIFAPIEEKYGQEKGSTIAKIGLESTWGQDRRAYLPNARYKGPFQLSKDIIKKYNVKNPFDLREAAEASAKYSRDNAIEFEKKTGRKPEPYEDYTMHQQGMTGYSTLAKHPEMKAVDALKTIMKPGKAISSVRKNMPPSLQGKIDYNEVTAQQFMEGWKKEFTKKLAGPDGKGQTPEVVAKDQNTETPIGQTGGGGFTPQPGQSPYDPVTEQFLREHGIGVPQEGGTEMSGFTDLSTGKVYDKPIDVGGPGGGQGASNDTGGSFDVADNGGSVWDGAGWVSGWADQAPQGPSTDNGYSTWGPWSEDYYRYEPDMLGLKRGGRVTRGLEIAKRADGGRAVEDALRLADPFAKGGPVWNKPRPKSLGKPKPLSSKQKSKAKAAAKAAGRPYPNLIDNMRAAKGK